MLSLSKYHAMLTSPSEIVPLKMVSILCLLRLYVFYNSAMFELDGDTIQDNKPFYVSDDDAEDSAEDDDDANNYVRRLVSSLLVVGLIISLFL